MSGSGPYPSPPDSPPTPPLTPPAPAPTPLAPPPEFKPQPNSRPKPLVCPFVVREWIRSLMALKSSRVKRLFKPGHPRTELDQELLRHSHPHFPFQGLTHCLRQHVPLVARDNPRLSCSGCGLSKAEQDFPDLEANNEVTAPQMSGPCTPITHKVWKKTPVFGPPGLLCVIGAHKSQRWNERRYV